VERGGGVGEGRGGGGEWPPTSHVRVSGRVFSGPRPALPPLWPPPLLSLPFFFHPSSLREENVLARTWMENRVLAWSLDDLTDFRAASSLPAGSSEMGGGLPEIMREREKN